MLLQFMEGLLEECQGGASCQVRESLRNATMDARMESRVE